MINMTAPLSQYHNAYSNAALKFGGFDLHIRIYTDIQRLSYMQFFARFNYVYEHAKVLYILGIETCCRF